jgi:hypothetical protein
VEVSRWSVRDHFPYLPIPPRAPMPTSRSNWLCWSSASTTLSVIHTQFAATPCLGFDSLAAGREEAADIIWLAELSPCIWDSERRWAGH